MLRREARGFLRRHPPFDRLDDEALENLVAALTLEVHPAGTAILRQGAPPPDALYLVKQGLVRIAARTGPGSGPVLDYRGVGESFGFLARGAGEQLEASVEAVSDTVCYVAAGDQVRGLLADHPALADFLLPAYFPRRDDRTPGAAPLEGILHEGSEKILFTTPVRDLAAREVVTVPAALEIREAARLMAGRRIGALVVTDAGGRPAGVVTTTDLRDRVLVPEADPAGPVGGIMSAPPVTIDAGDFCFEALLKMLGHGVHHLLVTEAGAPAGIVSASDFLILQGTSPLIIAREIEGQTSVEGLAVSARRVLGLIALLLREGATAGSIIRVITGVNDRIERRILDLALAALGPPPVRFVWIVYGSAGRKEQTFKTDQDNAIVHEDPPDRERAAAAEEYFARFAEFVVDAALRCGFARCEGDFMATNPAWRRPLAAWKRAFRSWIAAPDETAVYHAANFFDFRGLHGDQRLAAELKAHLLEALAGQTHFLRAMAEAALAFRPPLGLFGELRTARDGEHAHTLDLKKHCLVPLVNLVRIWSFERGVAATSTVERLAALRGVHPAAERLGDDLEQAFEFLSLLRIRHQHERIARGLAPDNFVNPKRLGQLERRTLREACRLIDGLLDDLERTYDVTRQL